METLPSLSCMDSLSHPWPRPRKSGAPCVRSCLACYWSAALCLWLVSSPGLLCRLQRQRRIAAFESSAGAFVSPLSYLVYRCIEAFSPCGRLILLACAVSLALFSRYSPSLCSWSRSEPMVRCPRVQLTVLCEANWDPKWETSPPPIPPYFCCVLALGKRTKWIWDWSWFQRWDNLSFHAEHIRLKLVDLFSSLKYSTAPGLLSSRETVFAKAVGTLGFSEVSVAFVKSDYWNTLK